MNEIATISQGFKDAADGFEKMQKALLVFAGVAALGLLLAGISLLKTSNP